VALTRLCKRLGKINPEHFLDKVFDIKYVVPKPSPEKYEEFLMSLVMGSQRILPSGGPLKGRKLNFSVLARVLRYNPRKAKRVASLLKRPREDLPEKYSQRYPKFSQKYLMATLYVATLEIVSPSMILDIRDEISNIRGNKELMKALLKFASEENLKNYDIKSSEIEYLQELFIELSLLGVTYVKMAFEAII